MRKFFKYCCQILIFTALFLKGVLAQENSEKPVPPSLNASQKTLNLPDGAYQVKDFTSLGHFRDWEAFSMLTQDEMVCWVSTSDMNHKQNQEKTAAKFLKPSALMVAIRFENNNRNEFSYHSKFELDNHKPLRMMIDNAVGFQLSPQAHWAWLKSAVNESRFILAAEKGLYVKILGKTVDDKKISEKYSLIGFTKAYEKAFEVCKSEFQKRTLNKP